MKYMTFNSSCSYAGVANMLLQLGIDVEDRQIARGMNLPYLFDLQEGVYSAGPMLQSANWFNLYLNTLGYTMVEIAVSRADIPDYLLTCRTAMLGLPVTSKGKHAVVFIGMDGEKFQFINNKWQGSDVPEQLSFSREELVAKLEDPTMVATIRKAPVSIPDFSDLYLHSCQVLEQYREDIQTFCSAQKTKAELAAAMNTLFRATLLDGITMLELLGQENLAEQFRRIQRSFLDVMREGTPVVLREKLNMLAWLSAIEQYIVLIRSNL